MLKILRKLRFQRLRKYWQSHPPRYLVFTKLYLNIQKFTSLQGQRDWFNNKILIFFVCTSNIFELNQILTTKVGFLEIF